MNDTLAKENCPNCGARNMFLDEEENELVCLPCSRRYRNDGAPAPPAPIRMGGIDIDPLVRVLDVIAQVAGEVEAALAESGEERKALLERSRRLRKAAA